MIIEKRDYNKLVELLSIKRPQKKWYVYGKISKFYRKYPETIKSILKNINKIGYYKDWFYILVTGKHNKSLVDYIYKLILDKLAEDLKSYDRGEKISTLSKWMPRENGFFDKKVDFVNKFSELLFPDEKRGFTRKKKYRKMMSKLNKYLDTTEIKLCNKDMKNINFNNISNICLHKHKKMFIEHEDTNINFQKYLFDKYLKFNIFSFTKKILSTNILPFEQNILIKIWNTKKEFYINNFFHKIYTLNNNNKKYNILLDMSSNMINTSTLYVIIGSILVLVEHFKLDYIYTNCYKPNKISLKNLNVIDMAKKILNNSSTFRSIEYGKLDKDKHIICFTDKNRLIEANEHIIFGNKIYVNEEEDNITFINCEVKNKKNVSYVERLIKKSPEYYKNNLQKKILYIFIFSILLLSIFSFFYQKN